MEKDTVTFYGEGVEVEVTLDEIAEALGQQFIVEQDVDDHEFAYLSALALETYRNDRYDIEQTLMEFIRNTGSLEDLTREDCDKIEEIFR